MVNKDILNQYLDLREEVKEVRNKIEKLRGLLVVVNFIEMPLRGNHFENFAHTFGDRMRTFGDYRWF